MLPELSQMHLLVKVTLLKTANPVVSRVLAVSNEANFDDLHHGIAASFCWNEEDRYEKDPATIRFDVTRDNPFGQLCPENCTKIRSFIDNGDTPDEFDEDSDDEEDLSGLSWKVRTVFRDPKFRQRYMIYEYDREMCHAVELLGRSPHNTPGKVFCVGGEGSITQNAWNAGRKNERSNVNRGGPSSWEVDFGEIDKRLRALGSPDMSYDVFYKKSQEPSAEKPSAEDPALLGESGAEQEGESSPEVPEQSSASDIDMWLNPDMVYD